MVRLALFFISTQTVRTHGLKYVWGVHILRLYIPVYA